MFWARRGGLIQPFVAPIQPARVNTAHPLAYGLRSLWLPSQDVGSHTLRNFAPDLSAGNSTLPFAAGILPPGNTTTPSGIAMLGDNGNNYGYYYRTGNIPYTPARDGATGVTFAAICSLGASTQTGFPSFYGLSDVGNIYASIIPSGTNIAYNALFQANGAAEILLSFAATVGRQYLVVGTSRSTTDHEMQAIDLSSGALYRVTSTTNIGSSTADFDREVLGGANYGNNNFLTGTVGGAWCWNRGFSSAEVSDFLTSPFEMLQPASAQRMVDSVDTGSSIVSGAGSASGVVTVSAAGASIVSGTASSAGTNTTAGQASAIVAATATVSSLATATAVGRSTASTLGVSVGSSTISAAANAVVGATGVAVGTSALSITSQAIYSFSGAALGSSQATANAIATTSATATAAGTSQGLASAVDGVKAAVASASGIAAVVAAGQAIASSAATSSGLAAVQASVVAIASSQASTSGQGQATATARAIAASTAAVAGTSSVAAIGNNIVSAVATSSGTVSIVGASNNSPPAVAQATGVSSVVGAGSSIVAATASSASNVITTATGRSIISAAATATGVSSSNLSSASVFIATALSTSQAIVVASGAQSYTKSSETLNAGLSTAFGSTLVDDNAQSQIVPGQGLAFEVSYFTGDAVSQRFALQNGGIFDRASLFVAGSPSLVASYSPKPKVTIGIATRSKVNSRIVIKSIDGAPIVSKIDIF